MSDFLQAGRHFPSPNFWLFETEREFFNSHRRLHSERRWRFSVRFPVDCRTVKKTACGLFSDELRLLHCGPNACTRDVVVAVS
jgi:hypothetical protein